MVNSYNFGIFEAYFLLESDCQLFVIVVRELEHLLIFAYNIVSKHRCSSFKFFYSLLFNIVISLQHFVLQSILLR